MDAAPSLMYRPAEIDSRRCLHYRWVEITPRGVGCICPKCLYGQASELRTCCSYEREPGSDDELPTPYGRQLELYAPHRG
jgi:hypothetical protein